MKKKVLSAQQLRKANAALLMVMTFIFALFCFIECLIMGTEWSDGRGGIRIGIYVATFIMDFIITKKFIENMVAVRFMCIAFLVNYALMHFLTMQLLYVQCSRSSLH